MHTLPERRMAMAISVKVEDHSEEIKEAMRQAKKRTLEAIGLAAEGYAKEKAPKDTGRLQNSISHSVRGYSVYIGTNVEYAPYVEMGTVKMDPRPYIKPAIIEHVHEYEELTERYMKGG